MIEVGDGFSLSGSDNDSYYYEGFDDAPACESCGLVNDLGWQNPAFKIGRPTLDFSYTYDLAPIASDRFVEALAGIESVRFLPLSASPGHYLMLVDRAVRFDAAARGTRFTHPCSTCQRFTQVAGATPVVLAQGTILAPGLSSTDCCFGSARYLRPDRYTSQSPIFLADAATANLLRKSGLRGLQLEPIATNAG